MSEWGWVGKKLAVGIMQDAVCVNGDTFQQSYTVLTPIPCDPQSRLLLLGGEAGGGMTCQEITQSK